jgi:predicted dehydrogenase
VPQNPLRIGLIGAGAIAQHAFLPALKGTSNILLTSIVDTDLKTVDKLSKKYTLDYIGPNIDQCLNYVDAVIVATPNFLHAPVAIQCMESGKHVLCEKPLSCNSQSAYEMVDCAKRNSVKLAVSHVRRFYPSSQAIKKMIENRQLGDVVSFDCEEGISFAWPTVSGFFFDKEKAGGGVLIDIGVHLLDLLIWWFDSEPSILTYEDDNLGGVEAFSRMKLRFHNSINGSVRLSRLSQLRNTYRIKCKIGTIEYDPFDMSSFSIYYNETLTEKRPKINRATKKSFTFVDAVKSMLHDFCIAIRDDRAPMITGTEGTKVLELIRKCYENKKPIEMPWL